MKTVIHKANMRGVGEYEWLSTRYSFSFADWFEPTRMGFGALRVINDDVIAPANGFGTHMHQDMEIITIVMKGAVTHTDSLGNMGRVSEGEVQVMSAGTGVAHSEYNDSSSEPLELFQLWIEPKEYGIASRYEQKHFNFNAIGPGSVQLVGKDSLHINQDAGISFAVADLHTPLLYEITEGNGLYAFVVDGEAVIAETHLNGRDAIGITEESSITITTPTKGRLLLIEVPMAPEA
jgi:redox-sensitive bicupin YhaK (pirin superfamily)